MPFVSLLIFACGLSLLPLTTTTEAPLSHYRGVTLGDSVQVVTDRLQLGPSDIKVVHERPSLVQEVTWRPRRFISGSTVESDPLAEMVLTFHAGKLARIAVAYDRERTQGMTNADLHEALSSVYGVSTLLSKPMQPTVNASTERQTFGRWEEGDTLLLLWREQYPSRVGLTITSVAADVLLRDALARGAKLFADEGPARDKARLAGEAAAVQARDEKIRLDNKTKFKP